MVLPKKYSFSRIFFLLFSLFLSVSLLSCAVHEPGVCIKDGKEYCVNSDWITVIDWDSCFRRGLNCMEGECWEYAIQEFTQAIQFVDEDMRNARPYGMFFRDYFPHREKGICHLYLGETMEALSELQLSLDQAPSSRAKYYLNKARQAYLRETGFDTSPPSIALELEETEYLANKTPFLITGKVQDDQFVASVRVNQAPIFIEMAEPSIPFTLSVDLDEGLNTIQVVAKDLVDREAQESIKVYFDSQGPKVMVNPVQTQQSEGANQVLITAVVYDESGIVSFKLDQKEVQRIGADDICLIEETIEHTPDRESIPFWTEDRSGNITQGSINLLSQRRRRPSLAMRLACSDDGILPIAMGEENSKISIHITYPPRDKFITHEPEIPLQGVIETQHGIRRMEINKQESLGVGAIQDLVERDRQRIIRELSRQKKDPDKYYQRLQKAVRSCNLSSVTINQRVSLAEGVNDLMLLVEDSLGHQEKKYLRITRVSREEIFKSEQRMLLAILPFYVTGAGAMRATICDPECLEYVYMTMRKSFKDRGRFSLVEEKTLEDVFSGDLIETACNTEEMCDENTAQQIGVSTEAEGMVCGFIQRWKGGLEIDARFREVEHGDSCLFHDIFSPVNTTEELREAVSHLAGKFHDSFPVFDGEVIDKEGQIIRVNIGEKNGLLPCMQYNVFEGGNEEDLVTRARIKLIQKETSEAEILEREKSDKVKEKGYKVRIR